MASKPNKKANQGKPVYKARQPAAQASVPPTTAEASEAPAKDAPAKGEQVNWHAVMNNASKQQERDAAKKPVDFSQIHAGGHSAASTAFQSTSTEPPSQNSSSNNNARDNARSYQPKNQNNQNQNNQAYQPRNNNGPRQHNNNNPNNNSSYGGGGGGAQGQGHSKGGHQNQHYNNNSRGGHNQGRGGYQNSNRFHHQQNPQAAVIGGMTPQMLENQPQLLTHVQNMQQMELSDIESLFSSICSQIDPELLQATLQQAGMQGVPGMPGMPGMPPFQGNRPGGGPQQAASNNMQRQQQRKGGADKQQYSGNNQSNYQQRGQDRGYGGQPGGKKYQSHPNQRQSMPMPGGPNKSGYSKMDSSDFPAFGAPATGSQGGQKMVYQAKKLGGKDGESESDVHASGMQGRGGGGQMKMQPFFTNAVQMNLCQVHFPEPIMMFKEKPLCKKCIQEEFVQQQAQFKKMSHTEHAMSNAKLLGLQHRPMQEFQSEKQKISRSLQRLDNFKKQFRYIEDDIKQREQMSAEHMRILTPLMNSMFEKLGDLVMQGEQKFKNKIFQIVRNQQKNIQDDMKVKLPQFYNRLQQKYNQLQQASNLAQQRGALELIETLKHFENIFTELDAEYEKYFNDYEKMSKLQRLLDKDANEIVRDFTDVVERNLRVDYNIKSSFGPQLPQRLHSFQWNQKCVQLFRLKTNTFEKKPVQMQYDVPLYSRSIATETGTIYLTGGYVKHMGVYLKNCYRYDDLFGILNQVSHMNYPHADHSICTIQNFIYVIGTFVGNQVYGYCEVYDTQKDKWKLIADMRVPRTGTSLCVFKNNYIFAFGGRVDQKRIVDTIECYDISRNVWQEIAAPKVDKSQWVPSYMGLAHQITDNEILLFGGKSASTFHIFNGCFVFDVEKMEIRERGSLVNPCSFMNTPLVFNHSLYAYGNDIYVHQYNIPEQQWSVIPKSSVVLPKA